MCYTKRLYFVKHFLLHNFAQRPACPIHPQSSQDSQGPHPSQDPQCWKHRQPTLGSRPKTESVIGCKPLRRLKVIHSTPPIHKTFGRFSGLIHNSAQNNFPSLAKGASSAKQKQSVFFVHQHESVGAPGKPREARACNTSLENSAPKRQRFFLRANKIPELSALCVAAFARSVCALFV